jgi:hypothetical protein
MRDSNEPYDFHDGENCMGGSLSETRSKNGSQPPSAGIEMTEMAGMLDGERGELPDLRPRTVAIGFVQLAGTDDRRVGAPIRPSHRPV